MNKFIRLISVLCVLAMLLIATTACSWFRPDIGKDSETDTDTEPKTETEDGPILPDYPPIETETGLKPIPGDTDTSAPSTSGGSVNITYTTTFNLDKSDKKITFSYSNPSKSNQNVLVIIKIDNVEIARSSLIPPGNNLTSLDITDEAVSKLVAGGYDAELVIGFYDPETNEKAMVDTKAIIKIQVQE